MTKRARTSVMVSIATVLCANLYAQAFLPTPAGTYGVGRTQFDWKDESRPDIKSADPNAKRELTVWLWYPASPRSDAQPAEWNPGKWGELLLPQLLRVLKPPLQAGSSALPSAEPVIPSPDVMRTLRAHACTDAPVSAKEKSYPVLIFFPGMSQVPT